MSDDVVENLKQPAQWLRILFMVIFVVILYVTGLVLLVLTLGQALFSVLTGKDNINLRTLGASLSMYVHQILRFLTYNTQARPFPFSPFPSGADGFGDDYGDDSGDGSAKDEADAPTDGNLDPDDDFDVVDDFDDANTSDDDELSFRSRAAQAAAEVEAAAEKETGSRDAAGPAADSPSDETPTVEWEPGSGPGTDSTGKP